MPLADRGTASTWTPNWLQGTLESACLTPRPGQRCYSTWHPRPTAVPFSADHRFRTPGCPPTHE